MVSPSSPSTFLPLYSSSGLCTEELQWCYPLYMTLKIEGSASSFQPFKNLSALFLLCAPCNNDWLFVPLFYVLELRLSTSRRHFIYALPVPALPFVPFPLHTFLFTHPPSLISLFLFLYDTGDKDILFLTYNWFLIGSILSLRTI